MTTPGDVEAFEQRLRRDARRRAGDGEAGDPELARLLGRVADDRARRASERASPPSRRATRRRARSSGGSPAPREKAPTVTARWPGEILAVESVAPPIRILRVARPPALQFRAGQYVKVGVAGGPRRDLSLASAPHEPDLELCIELVQGGTFTPAVFGLRPGDRLEVGDGAKGRFVLDESAGAHLLVATVTGIAPVRSMVLDALHRGLPRELIVLHGASHADELPYRDELVALAATEPRLRYVPTVSRPRDPRNRSWRGRTGRVDLLAVEEADTLDPRRTVAYAVGNSGMVAAVSSTLGRSGFTVRTEAFD